MIRLTDARSDGPANITRFPASSIAARLLRTPRSVLRGLSVWGRSDGTNIRIQAAAGPKKHSVGRLLTRW